MNKEKLKYFIIGFIMCGILSSVSYADIVLDKIYVSFSSVNKIIIDGIEKNPPEDMKPLVYNGRTYVALRYVSEQFGKAVQWDGDTGTINIGTGAETGFSKVIEDDLTGSLSKSDNWELNPNWAVDEMNGAYASYQMLVLNRNKYNSRTLKYSAEVDVAVKDWNAGFWFNENHLGWVVINGDKLDVSDFNSSSLIAIPNFKKDEYNKLKIEVDNNKVDIYVNDKYLSSMELKKSVEAFGLGTSGGPNYFKNFKFFDKQ